MIYTVPIERNTNLIKRTIFEPPKEGVECMFIQLDEKSGIKIYPTKRNAKFACNRQKKAYKCGVAPNVLSKICKCFVGNLLQFDEEEVFLTNLGNPRVYGYFYKTEVAKKAGRYSAKEFEELDTIFDHLGFDTQDLEARNLGRIDGKLVAIDFGKISTWN